MSSGKYSRSNESFRGMPQNQQTQYGIDFQQNEKNSQIGSSISQKSFKRFRFAAAPQVYEKLFAKVKLYETDKRKISRRFHQIRNMYSNLSIDECIQLIKQQFRKDTCKVNKTATNSQKYSDVISKFQIDQYNKNLLMKLYFEHESNIPNITQHFNKFIKHKSKEDNNSIEYMDEKQIQLLMVQEIKKYLAKIESLTKQGKFMKVLIPFKINQLNSIAHRFLQVHRGKVYSIDRAFSLNNFEHIFCQDFLTGNTKIQNNELQKIYRFIVNLLSAVQTQSYAKNKVNARTLNKGIEMGRITSEKLMSPFQGNKGFSEGIQQNSNPIVSSSHPQFLDQRYFYIVKFYVEYGDWKIVLEKLIEKYGSKLEYYQWSSLQHKMQSFLRVIYQLFLTRISRQPTLAHYAKQLPPQGKLKFIYILTWPLHKSLLFKLFYYYLHEKELQTEHVKEVLDEILKNKDVLCKRKKDIRKESKIKQENESNNKNNEEGEIQLNHIQKIRKISYELLKQKQDQEMQKFDEKKQKFTLESCLKQAKKKWEENANEKKKKNEEVKKEVRGWRKIQPVIQDLKTEDYEEIDIQQQLIEIQNYNQISAYDPNQFNEPIEQMQNFDHKQNQNQKMNLQQIIREKVREKLKKQLTKKIILKKMQLKRMESQYQHFATSSQPMDFQESLLEEIDHQVFDNQQPQQQQQQQQQKLERIEDRHNGNVKIQDYFLQKSQEIKKSLFRYSFFNFDVYKNKRYSKQEYDEFSEAQGIPLLLESEQKMIMENEQKMMIENEQKMMENEQKMMIENEQKMMIENEQKMMENEQKMMIENEQKMIENQQIQNESDSGSEYSQANNEQDLYFGDEEEKSSQSQRQLKLQLQEQINYTQENQQDQQSPYQNKQYLYTEEEQQLMDELQDHSNAENDQLEEIQDMQQQLNYHLEEIENP